ncbi:MAG: hypothetical protein FWB88_12220 [Defluviitaleaceae bacterium]|nr:hypothetical protein [Defluviitaleaceae bacterium]MCL2240329.1 hypothetical protein [Defluviitaleaceae bacterium]
MKIKLRVDPNNQWFVNIVVKIGNHQSAVKFKIDTGCNALVLSHDTLTRLGISAEATNLAKLPDETVRLASGEKSPFKRLGTVSLLCVGTKPLPICTVPAICHATRETNDLLGTEVLRRFGLVFFNLTGEAYMELQ